MMLESELSTPDLEQMPQAYEKELHTSIIDRQSDSTIHVSWRHDNPLSLLTIRELMQVSTNAKPKPLCAVHDSAKEQS